MNYLEHKIIIIGASTGGPGHIEKILFSLKEDFNASIVIAQHMGSEYLPSFAKAMDEKCRLKVKKIVDETTPIEKKSVYICDGVCVFDTREGSLFISKSDNSKVRFNPDIDTLFKSAVNLKDQFTVMSVILTGIGDDGSDGCFKLIEEGIECIGENEESAVVFGMPKKAKEKNQKVKLKSLEEIIKEIKEFGK